MKLEIDIHPAAEKPNRSGWFIILDRAGRWRRSYYDRRDMYWDPRDITYWAEMPAKNKLDYLTGQTEPAPSQSLKSRETDAPPQSLKPCVAGVALSPRNDRRSLTPKTPVIL